jgi:hypothetical protein
MFADMLEAVAELEDPAELRAVADEVGLAAGGGSARALQLRLLQHFSAELAPQAGRALSRGPAASQVAMGP